MQAVVRVDADQMGVKGGMMEFRQRNAIGYHRLAEPFVLVGNDVGCVQEQRFGEPGQGAAAVIGADDGFTERRLMQPLLDEAQGIPPFRCVLWRAQGLLI